MRRYIIWGSIGMLVILGFIILMFVSNPWNAKRIGEVPCPMGYTRLSAEDSYTVFLRELPLKKRGSLVHLYTGEIARLQFLSAGVVDIPVLSNSEQCADMAMRIRAEYLFREGRYADIRFQMFAGSVRLMMAERLAKLSRNTFVMYMRSAIRLRSIKKLKQKS